MKNCTNFFFSSSLFFAWRASTVPFQSVTSSRHILPITFPYALYFLQGATQFFLLRQFLCLQIFDSYILHASAVIYDKNNFRPSNLLFGIFISYDITPFFPLFLQFLQLESQRSLKWLKFTKRDKFFVFWISIFLVHFFLKSVWNKLLKYL